MADNKVFFQAQPLIPVSNRNTLNPLKNQTKITTNSFDTILQQKINEVKFSQHAQERLNSRNIKLSATDLKKLDNAVEKIAQKGAKESLIMLNDVALVVSVKNKTVITAMDGASEKDNIFTNIDSAMII